MNLIVNADKNWGIGKNNELSGRYEIFPQYHDRKSSCDGKKNIRKLSKWNAASKENEYRIDT